MFRIAVVSLALALLAACTTPRTLPQTAPPCPTRSEVQRLRHEQHQLRRELERLRLQLRRQRKIVELARSLQRVRSLPLLRPLRVGWIGAAAARRHMQRDLERDMPPGFARDYVATLARVGLLPRGYPLLSRMVALAGEQVAGFYDPRSGQLFVRSDMPAGEIVLSHEMAHALQDQSFPLQALLGELRDQDDRSFAIRALVEGDATLTMVQHLRRGMTLWKAFGLLPDLLEAMAMDDTRIRAAPAYLRESLTQPYIKGMEFVQALLQRGGWDRVNRAFRQPPISSEQVLHPQKYLADEQPRPVTIPELPGLKTARVLHENTLGEFGISVLLGASAGAGWNGDRLRSYRRTDGSLLLVWHTQWDTPRDAREFAQAQRDHLEPRRVGRRSSGRPWITRDGVVEQRLRGSGVLLVDGARDAAQAAAVARACGF